MMKCSDKLVVHRGPKGDPYSWRALAGAYKAIAAEGKRLRPGKTGPAILDNVH